MIRLRGKWLKLAGFEEGLTVRVDAVAGKLVLTLDKELDAY
jgi:hypothetical protein